MTSTLEETRFRVWCLTWDEQQEHGMDVVFNSSSLIVSTQHEIVLSFVAPDAAVAAEAYAEHVHDQRDGYESEWPLTFRVRAPDGATTDFAVTRDYEPVFSASGVR